ncbi:6-pyruvoyl trahydropterin synthase family protein [Candidatus Nitrosocosmicus franklandus]|uniref:6-pyruvoyl tetrahydropterin synthase n=1 Tax=Candidatus Nitrosocosmicus franklandianus TaxID=1798806 RepID=A0A484I944_9ARCH|nr:6-carboxytetrahydropterin synthase [Candidatus Nitrosocosmicus franklandus]VFJ13741.1 6-pyruvoyl tetrahydropterin synthase [Candidatus Nitrosocosmicus franklandus]
MDKDLKFIGQNKNLVENRTGYSISKLLDFLKIKYEYNNKFNDSDLNIDFKIGDKYIKIIEDESDMNEFRLIKEKFPLLDIIAIGKSSFLGKINEMDSIFLFDKQSEQIGSIFIDDPSLAFDYAHILPLVEKCSIIHGHTSTIMVEIIGEMKNNLVIDFSEAKKIIKEALYQIDHKFFINKKYLKKEEGDHYFIEFDGPKGYFDLKVPKYTTYLLDGEATVENLSTEIIAMLSNKMPPNVQALGVYIYEGVNKGAHILSYI